MFPSRHGFGKIASRALVAIALAFLAVACGRKTSGEDVVARIGDRTIQLHEVEDWVRSLGLDYQTMEDAKRDRRNRLDKLINEECMVIGAYDAGLAGDGEVNRIVATEEGKFLIDLLYDQEIKSKVHIDERDVNEWYDHFFLVVRPRHIVTKTRAEADSMLERLRAGADFADLARRYSIDRSTGPRGGDLGRGFRYSELEGDLRDLVFSLNELEVGGPVQSDFGWHVVQILERRELPERNIDEVRTVIENGLRKEIEDSLRIEQMKRLRDATEISINTATLGYLQWVTDRLPPDSMIPRNRYRPIVPDSLPEDMRDSVLATIGKSGRITLSQFVREMNNRAAPGHPRLDDLKALEDVLFELGTFSVLYDEAHRLGLQNHSKYRDQVLGLKERLMREKFVQQVLPRGMQITEDRAHRFYEAHPDSFSSDVEYYLHEMLLSTEEEANSALELIRGGRRTFESLARATTLRSGYRENGGDLGWVQPRNYRPQYQAAQNMAVGELAGPILDRNKYSIIRLDSIKPAELFPYEQVRNLIFDELTQHEIEERQQRFVDSIKTSSGFEVDSVVLFSMIREEDIGKEHWGPGFLQLHKDSLKNETDGAGSK